MGTDIGCAVQRRAGDTWEYVDWHHSPVGGILNGRNYFWFGVLAGVRNYDVTPIQTDRGLPPDVDVNAIPCFGTPVYGNPNFAAGECWHMHDQGHIDDPHLESMGDYGYGYVTLTELLAYPWHELEHDVDFKVFGRSEELRRIRDWLATLGAPSDVRLIFGFD